MTSTKRIVKKSFIQWLTDHPHSVNETYAEHFKVASVNGVKLILAGVACLIHSILPILFVNTASQIVKGIHQTLEERKNRR